MMNRSLRSLDRVFRLLFTLNRLNSWCQIDLVVKVLLCLFLTDNMVLESVVDAIRGITEGCLRRDSVGGRALLLGRPRRDHCWTNLGKDGLHGGVCVAIGNFGAVCVLRPRVGGVSLHAFWAGVAFVIAVLTVGVGTRIVLVADVVVRGVAEGVISVAVLIVVLSRFASKDGRRQKSKDGLEDADDKGDHGVQKPRSLSTWAIRRSEVPTSYHLCRLLWKTKLKRAATRPLLLPLPVLFLSCPLSCLACPSPCCLHFLTANTQVRR